MKNNKWLLCVFSLILTLSCGSDDNSSLPDNRAPNSFLLLQVPDNETNVVLIPHLTWESAIDPDGDSVSYNVLLDEG